MIPVSIVTGFLGSGKTTLISRLLRDPDLAGTAVIVNEFGEIGLDHELIASSDESLTMLTTGCICCAVRSDLVETLLDLQARREAGTADYQRVLIETSGLADPAPILQALMTDPGVNRTHALDSVVTLVDPVFGATSLARHAEARRQVALADLLVWSKPDVATPDEALREVVGALNGSAPHLRADAAGPAALFAGADAMARAARLLRLPGGGGANPFAARHDDAVHTTSLRLERPMPALALTMLLSALAEHCGERLLRMKGLVAVEEMPGQPAVVHGVRHVFATPAFLPTWPSADTATRLVFITQGVPPHFPARLLEAIEAEVREEMQAIGGG